METVSWNDCQQFIATLNQMTGKNFRLATEAEWEYAARGGNKSQGYMYAGSNTIDEIGWWWFNVPHSIESPSYGPQTVATKMPNELGIYDMSGNVKEWCQDWYGSYSSAAQTNPTGPATGSTHVRRGGCWAASNPSLFRVSFRGEGAPDYRDYLLGFRIAM